MDSSDNFRSKFMKIFVILVLLTFPVYSQTVYKTPSGKKYHLASCRTVKNVSEAISVTEALKKGLTPCKICKPPVSSKNQFFNTQNKAKGEAETVQCKGITKKGTRCKHRTSIADGYCFQHTPKTTSKTPHNQ